MGATSELPSFNGGRIGIQLENNVLSVAAGQVVSGLVHVDLVRPVFDCSMITLGLYGLEDVFFKVKESHGSGKNRRTTTKTYKNHAEIISMVFPIYNFVDGPPRPGQMSFPF